MSVQVVVLVGIVVVTDGRNLDAGFADVGFHLEHCFDKEEHGGFVHGDKVDYDDN